MFCRHIWAYHQCTFACDMEDWMWWPKHSLLNLYFHSHDRTNAVSFTKVHTRKVLAKKGPFSGLAKCWRTYFLGDVVFQEKNLTVPSSTVYTSCLCFPPHVTQIIYNRSLTLLYAKANGFMIEEELSHEGTVQKHIKNWGKLKYRKGHYELSTLQVQNKASLHISKQHPCYSTGLWGT